MDMDNTVSAPGIKIWDGFIRTFHWSLVALFALAYITSHAGMQNTHILVGYLLTVLVLLRILWGFVGSVHARFSNFVYSPGLVLQYLKTILVGHPQRYLGHNPAGGAMVMVKLLSLAVMTVSGFIIEAGIEFEGPLVSLLTGVGDQTVYLWRHVHHFTTNLMLALIAFHVLGVILASRQHNENLVRAMVTGYKQQ